MSRGDVRDVVVGVLATKMRRDAGELYAELHGAGPECPCDSVWLVKAAVGAARVLGLQLPRPTKSTASAFKSVEALTSYLYQLVEEREAA